MTFAEKLVKLRKSNGMSQEDLADKLGVSRQAISKWESMQSVPDLLNVLNISSLFKVSTDYLLKADCDCKRADDGTTEWRRSAGSCTGQKRSWATMSASILRFWNTPAL